MYDIQNKLKKVPTWFWLLLIALIILGALISPWFLVIAVLGPLDEILFIIVLLFFFKAIRIVFIRKNDVADRRTAYISILILLLVTVSIVLFTVDLPVLHEVAQNPEYFYASSVVGISMTPHIFTGDTFIIQTVNHPEYVVSVGDILIYTYKDMFIGHRVTAITPDYIIVRGDANTDFEYVSFDNVVGRVYKTVSRRNIVETFFFGMVLK